MHSKSIAFQLGFFFSHALVVVAYYRLCGPSLSLSLTHTQTRGRTHTLSQRDEGAVCAFARAFLREESEKKI